MWTKRQWFWWQCSLGILITIGIGFRFFHLDYKVVWHDEVYTLIRAAGYTRLEIDLQIFQDHIIPVERLQVFQHIKPGSTVLDTVRSLVLEDPQHPPLYFVMARAWMQAFGSSLWVSRLLSVLLSLLALPCIYGLSQELFHPPSAPLQSGQATASNHAVGNSISWLAVALLALSPFEVLHAQVTRQYSLLTVMTIASGWLLLRALRTQTLWAWASWSMANLLGLYTQPFFGLVMIAQGVYIGGLCLLRPTLPHHIPPCRYWVPYLLGASCVTLLYAPWLWVMMTQSTQLLATTQWTADRPDMFHLFKLWILSFSCLVLDLDPGFNNPLTYLLRLPVILLAGWGMLAIVRQTRPTTWLYVLTAVMVPFGLLAVADGVTGGQRSAVTRYLTASFPGVYLAIAYLIAPRLLHLPWQGLLAVLTGCSIASCGTSALATSWWHQTPSTYNAEIARRVEQLPAALFASDRGNDFTNTGDLISLSYHLPPTTPLLLFKQPANPSSSSNHKMLLLFRPSAQLIATLDQVGWQRSLTYPEGELWLLTR